MFINLLVSGGAWSQSLTDSLILHYPFNGNAEDISTNQFHGLTNGTYCPDPWGNPGASIHFNGFDQYLDFPVNQPKLKPNLPISVAYWVRFDDITFDKTYVFDTDYDQNNHSGLWMFVTSWGPLAINYGDATNNTSIHNRRSMWGTTPIEANRWYYIIGIARGPLDMEIYIDCQAESKTYEGYGGEIGYTDCQGGLARIDHSMVTPPVYFQGSIDDFMYWNRALTLEDIEILCAFTGPTENPSITMAGVKVFPNPVFQSFTIEMANPAAKFYRIINIMGSAGEILPYTESINVGYLSSGSYTIEILDNNKRILQRACFLKI